MLNDGLQRPPKQDTARLKRLLSAEGASVFDERDGLAVQFGKPADGGWGWNAGLYCCIAGAARKAAFVSGSLSRLIRARSAAGTWRCPG